MVQLLLDKGANPSAAKNVTQYDLRLAIRFISIYLSTYIVMMLLYCAYELAAEGFG